MIPSDAYVCTGKTKTFEVWGCGATGETENVTASAEFDSSVGTMTGATLTAPEEPSSSEGVDWVEASYDGDTDRCELTVVQVEIGELDRVPPGGTKGVKVTVSPSLTGASIGLEAKMTSGTSGSATLSHSSINSTTTVAVTGGAQTSAGDAGNVSLIATLDECDNECECDDEPFTVCAHPINYSFSYVTAVPGSTHYGLVAYYAWGSDSGSTDDLDKCELTEVIEDLDVVDNPPFNITDPPPEADPIYMDESAGDVRAVLKTSVYDYKDGWLKYDQTQQYECKRCGLSEESLSENDVSHHVYDFGGGDYRIETKVIHSCAGVTVTRDEDIAE